jgi:hypothetical protein
METPPANPAPQTPPPNPRLAELETALAAETKAHAKTKKLVKDREMDIATLQDENKELRRQLFEAGKKTAPPAMPAKKETDWNLPDYFKN